MHLGSSQKPFLSQPDAVDNLRPACHQHRVQYFKVLLLFIIFQSLTACRTKDADQESSAKESTDFFSTPPEKVTDLESNRLAEEPSKFLRSHSSSPIHWQPWTNEILDQAERSQRLIFVCVGSTVHPNTETLLKLLESKFTNEINEKYVPVLADTELDPTLALACNLLSSERRDPIAFPFLMWLSHEGNPVAWVPVSLEDEESLLLGFRRIQNTVESILEKSPRYVVENSRYDNENRLKRIEQTLTLPEGVSQQTPTKSSLFLTAQSLSDLYDSIDRTFDNTGGIPPGNLITTLSRLSDHPAAPSRFQRNARTATKESVELLTEAAIRDPLDDYFFDRRNSRSFAVPNLSKTLRTQAEMLSAMSNSPSTPASKRAVSSMLEELAQNPFLSTALYPNETNELAYFWSISALSDLLTDDEMAVAKAAFKLKTLGNVPTSDDPRRLYFRRNTLGLALFGAPLANKVGMSEAKTEQLLASVIEKLRARRAEILETSDSLLTEDMITLGPKARLLTALLRTQATSPQSATLKLVDQVGQEILTNFVGEDGRLLRVPTKENSRAVPAFAYDYAVTIEALLAWYRLTWKSEYLKKATELTQIFLDDFLGEDNFIIEVDPEKHPLTFPVHNRTMIFGPSTWGIALDNLNRMSALGFQHPKLKAAIDSPAPLLVFGLKLTPVVHTDYLMSALNGIDGYVTCRSRIPKEQSIFAHGSCPARVR